MHKHERDERGLDKISIDKMDEAGLSPMERFIQQFELSEKKTEALRFKLTDDDDGYGMTDPNQFKTMNLTAEELTLLENMIPRAKQAQWTEAMNQIIGTAPAPPPPPPQAFQAPQSPLSPLSPRRVRKNSGAILLRVHASFSSKIPASLLSQVQDAVFKSNMESTWMHTAQTEGWFVVWSADARRADFIIVFFTAEYRARFTEALWMEALLIYELYQSGINVYFFDSDSMAASDVRVNLTDLVKTMGSFTEWWTFCKKHSASLPNAAAAAAAAEEKVCSSHTGFRTVPRRDLSALAPSTHM